MLFRSIDSDADIAAAYPLMSQLRPHLLEHDFVQTIRAQQAGGYVLVGGFDGSTLVTLAGFRDTATLARGRHLFVDDLVTAAPDPKRGHATALLRHLATIARERGITRIYLDSRDTAVSYYRQAGFTFLTSVPCWIETGKLLTSEP